MATVNWIYGDMWRWFTEVGEDVAYPVDDVVVNIFEANYEVIKYRTAPSGQEYGPLEPFVKRNSQVHKVHATDPMVSAHSHSDSGTDGMVQHGMYIVTEKEMTPKKTLLIVCPRKIGTILVAEHFGWCVDRRDKDKRAVHLHVTRYIPFDLIPGIGWFVRISNYLASSIDAVPRDLEAFKALVIRNNSMGPFAGLLRDVMLRPYAAHPVDGLVASTAFRGGSGGDQNRTARRPRPRRHRHRCRASAADAAAAAAVADPHRDRRTPFEQAWFDLPLRKIVVIGVPSASPTSDLSVHFTAYVYDRLSHPLRGGSSALHFVLGAAAAHDEARVTSAIAGLLAGRTWDDFVDIPEDEVY
jgi:hypothetical protein